MSEIPEDIRRLADKLTCLSGLAARADAIAMALKAERERCAEAAKAYLDDLAGCDMRNDEPDLIAAAILSRTNGVAA